MTPVVTVHVEASGQVGSLHWEPTDDQESLARAVTDAAERAFAQGLRRLEAGVPAEDVAGRRGLQRSGFRREGIRRQVLPRPDGGFGDLVLYSRLADDTVGGGAGFSAVMDTVLPTKRMIAHVLFRNGAGEVLLLQTSYKRDWELPGGIVEPAEPPRLGAEREVVEELGLEVTLDQPAMVDWMPPYLGWSDAVEFIYDAGTLDEAAIATLAIDGMEILAAHWVAEPDLDQHVTPLSARRIRLLLQGFRGATEDGMSAGR